MIAGVASPNIKAPGVEGPPVTMDWDRARRLDARSMGMNVGAGLRVIEGAAAASGAEPSAGPFGSPV